MSNIVLDRTWQCSQQKNAYRLALITLADRANKEGLCDPGFADIAERCNVTERQAKRLVAGLEESGELYIGHGGGRYSTNLYFVTIGLPLEEIEATLQKYFNLGDRTAEIAQGVHEKIKGAGPFVPKLERKGVTRGANSVPDDTLSRSQDTKGNPDSEVDEVGKGVIGDTVYAKGDLNGVTQGQQTVSSIPPEPSFNHDSLNNLDKPLEGIAENVEPSLNGADAPPPPAIPVATFSDADLPDPGDYPLKQIADWKLYTRQWQTLLDRERQGRKRKNVIQHITLRLEKKPKAVEVYQATARFCPEKTNWEMIEIAVGEDPDDLDFFKRVIERGIAKGWYKGNVLAMVEHYERRELPGKPQGANNGNSTDDSGGNSGGKRQAKKPAGIRSSGWPIEPDRRYLDEYIASPALGD